MLYDTHFSPVIGVWCGTGGQIISGLNIIIANNEIFISESSIFFPGGILLEN
jgi:hypothetical protein